jgi:hypothetical protein
MMIPLSGCVITYKIAFISVARFAYSLATTSGVLAVAGRN